jgi:hypothetical protein
MILGDHEDSENSLKRKSPNALSAAQRRGGKRVRGARSRCNKGLHGEITLKGTHALFYIM